ncbi:MAG TPA: hypothetical protein VE130_08900 [Nitrososphaeraceae archaeon]|nr:hypothetical protein [Nitrososphaeraceae archaeon]
MNTKIALLLSRQWSSVTYTISILIVLASRCTEILRNDKYYVRNNVDKGRLLIGVIAIIATLSLYALIPLNITLSALSSDRSNQTEMFQIDVNAISDDILKAKILANSLENRLKDAGAILEITGNLTEVRRPPRV